MIKTELYFGQAIGEQSEQKISDVAQDITHTDFMRFVASTITPLFPDGLTILDAVGQYQMESNGQTVRERSKVVILLHEGDSEDHSKINRIREMYKQQFQQESVLRIDYEVNVRF